MSIIRSSLCKLNHPKTIHAPSSQEWNCTQTLSAEWFVEHVFKPKPIVVTRNDNCERLIEKLSDDCCFGLSATNWYRIALVAHFHKDNSYLENARYYILQGLEVDPYHERLLNLKSKIFPLIQKNNEREKPIYEKALAEKDSTKQALLVLEALMEIRRLGTIKNPLRLYYITEFREIVDVEDSLSYERSVIYIEDFFKYAGSEFFKENPELYVRSNLLILKVYLKILHAFAGLDAEKFSAYSKKLKQRVKLISKNPNLSKNAELRSLAKEITVDIDCLELKMLSQKVHEESEKGGSRFLIAFIKLFPKNFKDKVKDADVLINAAIIFFEQSKKSKNHIVKEKHLEKSRIIMQILLAKEPNNKDYLEIIIGIITEQVKLFSDPIKKKYCQKEILEYVKRAVKLEESKNKPLNFLNKRGRAVSLL